MLISRIFTTVTLKYQNRFGLTKTRSFLSHPSVGLSSENGSNQGNQPLNALDSLSTKKSIDDSTNNEWLWAYLRDRQSFSDLTEAQRRRVIEIELQTLRESGDRVPEVVPDDRWTQLINTPIVEHRKSIYGYLFLRELYRKRRASIVAENNIRRIESIKRRQELLAEGKPPTNYPGYSSIFRHLGRQQEKYLREQAFLAPAILGEAVVIDCGFENEHAREHYLLNLVDQIQYLFAEIHRYHSPSFVYLCNLSKDGRLQAEFNRRSPLETLCLEPTESSYLDVFPQEKLIYLSPDSNVEMTSFDHDAVYIIGGIIDLSGKKPLTFGKAKRDNIRHQRFPIDRYVKFGGGSGKTLTIDQVYNILMTLKHTGSWTEAFKYIPDRKVVERYSGKLDEKQQFEYEKFGRWTGLNAKH
ncbi:unnamed protein product [Rotaria socialis]|uniref:RNA (guanine-9-)-methyltransferase domain-containing protein 1 n=1 Tax=Rotaria socialis TaxID=392032 RepID=A0A820QUM8_9BILA|nr:unnamed protein product [Rotaria socialis]CAF3466959.1 unnamed protein product [Rotaria socialis]CAF4207823.1 unnamed protein product [Rotaria socialis]CAF4426962.1 unnamed protein product [Rotaria socialis]